MTRRAARLSGPAGLAFLLPFLLHLVTLRGGYVYDDVEAILENPLLRSFANLPKLFSTNYWGERNIGLYRPLVQTSYLLDGALFDFRPAFSHLLNALLNAGVALALQRLLVSLGTRERLASVAAVAFGIHPALLDASVWISGRTDLLAALFVLLGLRAAVAAGAREESVVGRMSLLCAFCFLLGLLGKEMAASLPFLILLLPVRGVVRRLPLLLIALLLYLGLRSGAVEGFLPQGAGIALQGLGPVERVLCASRALLWLLVLIPVPWALAADHRAHPFAHGETALGVTAPAAFSILFALGVLGLLLRRRHPLSAFLLVAIPLSLGPILQIVPIGAVMAERFLYLPGAFAIPLLAIAGDGLLRRLDRQRAAPWCAAILLALLALLSLGRFPVYRDRGAFSRDVLRAYPDDWAAANNLGVYLFLERDPPDHPRAVAALEGAIASRADYARGRLNLARALLEWHRSEPEEGKLLRAREALAPLSPRDPRRLYLEGKVDLRLAKARRTEAPERLEAAWEAYRGAAKGFEARMDASRAAAAWKEAGIAARRLRDDDRARRAWRRALELEPGLSGAAAMRTFLRSNDPGR